MYGDTLYFYEEILLLALKDKAGVTSVAFLEQSIAGAVLAELLLAKRIEAIINGEMTGKAVKQVIEACEAAAATSVIMSTVIIPTVVS